MMNIVFYTELRNLSQELRSRGVHLFTGRNHEELLKGYEAILDISSLARKKGLYSLEGDEIDYDRYPLGDYLKRMIMSIVDGDSAKETEELAMTLYFSSNLGSEQRLLLLLYLSGCIGLQKGENTYVIEKRLAAMLPGKIVEKYNDNIKQAEITENTPGSMTDTYGIVDRLCESEFPAENSSEYYLPLKMAEKVLLSMDDRCIQRLIRDVDNSDLAIFLKGISGAGRKSIFNNLSRRLAVMIAEDMEFMGDVRLKDSAGAAQKIIRIVINLLNSGEIVSEGDNDYLHMLHEIYKDGKSADSTQTTEYTESELEQVFAEYLNVIQRRI